MLDVLETMLIFLEVSLLLCAVVFVHTGAASFDYFTNRLIDANN